MVKASNVDMSLDDIIAKTKKNRNSIGKKSGGIRRGGPIKKFAKGGPRRSGWRDLDAVGDIPSIGGGNKIVRVNISNLAPSVIASDLDELFIEFGVETAVVNYNEHGESLGTGDITLRKRDAERLIKKFVGVSLDGQVMKFALVDSSGIAGRVDFGGARRLKPKTFKKKMSAESFLRDGVHEGEVRHGGKFRGKPGRRGRESKPKKTEAELDAELDAYMSKRKS